jgi:hypothetical protein
MALATLPCVRLRVLDLSSLALSSTLSLWMPSLMLINIHEAVGELSTSGPNRRPLDVGRSKFISLAPLWIVRIAHAS